MKFGLAIALVAAAGCGVSAVAPDGGAPTFPDAPLLSLPSDSGKLSLVVRSDPQPPTRGVNAFRVSVADTTGAPVEGLTLAVQPWMPDMAHGSSVIPEVTEHGGGDYDVTNVYLAMPGTWQLRMTVTGALSDTAAPEVQIP